MAEWERFLTDPSLGLVRAVRPAQVAMAQAVDDILQNGGQAMIQAGTGTGKSYGYGVPAFASGKRVVIATAKKSLQTQLLAKDLPRLAEVVRKQPFASLKGKANYACRLRHYEATDNQALVDEKYDEAVVNAFADWIAADPTADMANFPFDVPFEWLVRVQDCMKLSCPYAKDCGYLKTRLRAAEARVLVVNHSLLAYDLRLGGGKILGEYDALIIDEAHQAPRFFEKAFSYEFTEKQAEQLERAFQSQWDMKISGSLREAYKAFFRTVGTRPGKFELTAANERALVGLSGALAELQQECKRRNLLPEGPDEGVMKEPLPEGAEAPNRGAFESGKAKVAGAAAQVVRLLEGCAILLGSAPDAKTEYVGYTEQKDRHSPMKLTVAPLEVGPLVAPALLGLDRCVYTSATLTSGDGFNFFIREYGLYPGQVRVQKVLPSPFEYTKRSRLWISRDVPFVDKERGNRDEIIEKQAREIHELLKASRGGAFVICPSYADLGALYDRVLSLSDADRAPDGDRYYHQLLQTNSNVDALVAEFKSGWNNALFGVRSISEGVDVPGMKLRLVIITGLCFPHPSDILNRSRKDLIVRRMVENGQPEKKAGLLAFDQIDVQLAGIELAQAAGRLIRTENDFGVLAILDPRMHDRAKSYTGSLRRLIPHPVCSNKQELLKIVEAFHGLAVKAQQAGH